MEADVALRKESVDRNCVRLQLLSMMLVALRKESVDRNGFPLVGRSKGGWVALRKESVDRNMLIWNNSPTQASRSPQGERG